jgi:hypothetical protein
VAIRMSDKQLRESFQAFVEQQPSRTVDKLWEYEPPEERSPYGTYWYRAIACMLLSGRVKAKMKGDPNMTDVNRVGKEANFNQYLFERVTKVLVAGQVIQLDRLDRWYEKGPNFGSFWQHDLDGLTKASRRAFLYRVGDRTGAYAWRADPIHDSRLIEFLILFFSCFKGRAIEESRIGQVFYEFTGLPRDHLIEKGRGLGLKPTDIDPHRWKQWLDAEGRSAVVGTLYDLDWVYCIEEKKTRWLFASPTGLGMLGLEAMPPAPELSDVFKALPNLSVFAGAGLPYDKLVPLFRYAVIKRIDQVFEFQLDRRRLAESSATTSPGDELRTVFNELEPLPQTVASVLGTKSQLGGELGIRACSALVRPENVEVLEAIRKHPKLKGYIEPGAPPGHLLIKNCSDPHNFVMRCRELGFRIKAL